MSNILDNSAVSATSPVDDISPGDLDFPVDASAFPEPSDNAVSEPADDHTVSDESGGGSVSTPTVPSTPAPTVPETKQELQIIIVSPDGTMTIYDEAGNITAEVADTAYSLWLSENGALDKRFENYSVSEALLLFIALGALVGMVCKIFKRRKL